MSKFQKLSTGVARAASVLGTDIGSGAATSVQALFADGSGNSAFRSIVSGDIPTLNQNTTGSAASLSATLVATSGGTGQSTYTTGDTLYASATNTLSKLPIGSSGQVLTVVSGIPAWAPASGGVSSISINSTNGFAGSSSGGTTPALTISTTVTGVIKGNGTAISAATAGTDYSAGTSALITGILKSTTTTGALTIAVAGDFPILNQSTSGSAASLSATLVATSGGTGQSTYATGDTLYASATNTLSKLSIGTANQVLQVQGSNTVPSWQSIYQTSSPNYIGSNPNAEVDTTGWATYSNTAQNIPVNGTGGTATGLTFSRSTSSPLRGSASFSMVQSNSTSLQGKGVSYAFTIDSSDQAKLLNISYDFNASSTFVASNGSTPPLNDGTTSTNAGNSDVEIFIYDVTNSALIYVTPQVITANGSINYSFNGSFQTASNSTSYRLIFHVATANANATGWTFKFDNVFVGKQPISLGSVIQDPTQYTPVFGGMTATGTNAWYVREGATLRVWGTATSGSVTGSTLTFPLPTGLNIDSGKYVSGETPKVGDLLNASAAGSATIPQPSDGPWPIFVDVSASTTVLYAGNSGASNVITKFNGNGPFSNTQHFSFNFSVPIAGWSSNTQVSSDTGNPIIGFTAQATSGTLSGSFTDMTTWTSNITDSANAFNSSTGVYTIPSAGWYFIRACIGSNSAASTNPVFIQILVNGTAVSDNACPSTSGTVNAQPVVMYVNTFKPGDLIKVQVKSAVGSDSINSSNIKNNFSIFRISNPASLAATDSVGAFYTGTATGTLSSGSSVKVTFPTKQNDSHGAYSSGTYTIPISGRYSVSTASVVSLTAGSYAQINVVKNNATTLATCGTVSATNITNTAPCWVSVQSINLVAGDTIQINVIANGTSPSLTTNFTGDNFFSIVRTGN